MKMLNMTNLQTEECENIPTTKRETELLKIEVFNEGWWKGFIYSSICMGAGLIVGTIISNTILDSKRK